jgi:phosphatidylglycerophosphatase A
VSRWRLFIAQGFGIGRIPFAPGTFGTLLGLGWLMLLLWPGNYYLFLAGIVAGVLFSVWLCGEAEQILQKHDPPSVVLDEITALPICFVPLVTSAWLHGGSLPKPAELFTSKTWWLTAGLFALFRLFDIWKPWPVRQSQQLSGGWGVTVDDVLAAGYAALLATGYLLASSF